MDAFTDAITSEPLPPHFKAPTLETYDGTTDLDEYLESFRALMLLHGYSDTLTFRAFQVTFKGAARRWFVKLPPCSINSWEQLTNLFLAHFISSQRCQKSVVSLMVVRQRHDESLWSCIDRFKKEELEVRDLNPMVSVHATIQGLVPKLALKCSIAKTSPKTKAIFLKKAQKYIAAEEASTGKHRGGETDHDHGDTEKKRKNGDSHGNDNNKKKPSAPSYDQYTPLNSTQAHILMQVGEEEYAKWHGKKKRNPKKGDPRKILHISPQRRPRHQGLLRAPRRD
ncbi:PREDICTED: uncharacterized protein LOC104588740 [Nelumbo nucifera]|uniref:Uncharacterized protein LOC104588740 n=1 Tax=Nelumbo nucifera TaxID=4432 RepID=A0A1U7YX57_NELNU|nr:PREDICTED: uncharacterized protein LOC104588740 [Nelumbo nucifera]